MLDNHSATLDNSTMEDLGAAVFKAQAQDLLGKFHQACPELWAAFRSTTNLGTKPTAVLESQLASIENLMELAIMAPVVLNGLNHFLLHFKREVGANVTEHTSTKMKANKKTHGGSLDDSGIGHGGLSFPQMNLSFRRFVGFLLTELVLQTLQRRALCHCCHTCCHRQND